VRLQLRWAALAALLVPATASADDSPYVVSGSAIATGYSDTTNVNVLTPTVNAAVENPTAGWKVNGGYLVDIVSAASPDIVSTATRRWTEIRHGGSLGGQYKPGETGVAAAGTISSESDYFSAGGGGTLIQELDEKNLTLTAGYGHSEDTIGRHDTPFSVFSRPLHRNNGSLGFARTVDPATLFVLVLDGEFERGDQSKPYRFVPMFSAAEARLVPRGASAEYVAQHRLPERVLEQLPLERDRYALTARYAHRYKSSTFRIEERLYLDTWGLAAETTDGRWLFDTSSRLRVGPHVRVNGQKAVVFWEKAYVLPSSTEFPRYRTGDRELGGLWSFTGGGSMRLALADEGARTSWALTTSADLTYTTFQDTIYVKDRLALFLAIGIEVSR
jgi:hypothetical protein